MENIINSKINLIIENYTIKNRLHRNNIHTIKQLCSLTKKDLEFINGLSSNNVETIMKNLEDNNLYLKNETDEILDKSLFEFNLDEQLETKLKYNSIRSLRRLSTLTIENFCKLNLSKEEKNLIKLLMKKYNTNFFDVEISDDEFVKSDCNMKKSIDEKLSSYIKLYLVKKTLDSKEELNQLLTEEEITFILENYAEILNELSAEHLLKVSSATSAYYKRTSKAIFLKIKEIEKNCRDKLQVKENNNPNELIKEAICDYKISDSSSILLLNLPSRVENALSRYNIKTVEDLKMTPESKLEQIKTISKNTIELIGAKLKLHGFETINTMVSNFDLNSHMNLDIESFNLSYSLAHRMKIINIKNLNDLCSMAELTIDKAKKIFKATHIEELELLADKLNIPFMIKNEKIINNSNILYTKLSIVLSDEEANYLEYNNILCLNDIMNLSDEDYDNVINKNEKIKYELNLIYQRFDLVSIKKDNSNFKIINTNFTSNDVKSFVVYMDLQNLKISNISQFIELNLYTDELEEIFTEKNLNILKELQQEYIKLVDELKNTPNYNQTLVTTSISENTSLLLYSWLNIITIADLVICTEEKIKSIRGLGNNKLLEIREFLNKNNLCYLNELKPQIRFRKDS